MHRAIVLPPDPIDEPHVVEYTRDDEVLPLLYREIETECVDSRTIRTEAGDLIMWVSDDGLLQDEVQHNDRAIVLCRQLGYNVPDVAGTAVFTGGANAQGYIRDIPPGLFAWLTDALNALTAGAANYRAAHRAEPEQPPCRD